jgi:hypothetical protein
MHPVAGHIGVAVPDLVLSAAVPTLKPTLLTGPERMPWDYQSQG